MGLLFTVYGRIEILRDSGVNGTKKQILSYLVQLGVGLEECARWW